MTSHKQLTMIYVRRSNPDSLQHKVRSAAPGFQLPLPPCPWFSGSTNPLPLVFSQIQQMDSAVHILQRWFE